MKLTIVIQTKFPGSTKSLLALVQKWLKKCPNATMESWTQVPQEGDARET